jgi:hypothetical protein
VGWGGFYHIPEHKRDYIRNYIIMSFYYCFVSLGVLFLFMKIIDPLWKKITFVPLAILLFFFIVNFLTYFFSNKFLKKPAKFLEIYSHIHYLHLDYRYLFSKSFEIFFQQILIISLVFLLQQKGLNLYWISFVFAILFGFGHLPMIKLQKGFFGLMIFISSIAASFFFPFLILNFEWGFIYTYILHWLFYTNSGILFWIVKSDFFEKFLERIISKEKKIIKK